MFMYCRVPQRVPAMYLTRAAASIRALWPSGKAAHDPTSAADLPHDSLQRIVRADLPMMLVRERVIRQRLFDALADLLGGRSFIASSLSATALAFSWAATRSSWAWMALSMAATTLTWPLGTSAKTFL